MVNKRFVPLLLPFYLFLSNELLLLYPKAIFISAALGVLLIFFSIKFLSHDSKNKRRLIFSILPILIYLSLCLYTALLPDFIAVQAIIFISAAFIFYYFKNLYYYLVAGDESRLQKLESFSAIAGFLIIFSSFSSIYFLPFFIKLDINIMLLIALPLSAFLLLQPALFSQTKKDDWLPLLLVGTLIMAQLSWLFSLLPLNHNVLGLLSALTYYLLLTVTRLSLKGALNRKSLKWPLVLVIIFSLSLLLSARWL